MDTTLDSFTRAGRMTAPGAHAHLYDGLSRRVGDLAAIAQGVLIHEHIAPAYGVTLADERRATVHLRRIEELLARIVADDPRPLGEVRKPDARTAGNCRHFTVLLVSILRAQGVPARARCGFGGYFGTNSYEDHWVAEYWNAGEQRWVLVDAQIDDVQKGIFPIDFDLLDVPRDRFLVAGDAWARCRRGEADPGKFGLTMLNEAGYWWIAGNLLRDVAALNDVELLPWDVWGAMPQPEEPVGDELVPLLDRLADLTRGEVAHAELRAVYEADERIRVPEKVLNAVLNREEVVA